MRTILLVLGLCVIIGAVEVLVQYEVEVNGKNEMRSFNLDVGSCNAETIDPRMLANLVQEKLRNLFRKSSTTTDVTHSAVGTSATDQFTTRGEPQTGTGGESQSSTNGEDVTSAPEQLTEMTTTGEESQITTGGESQTTTGEESQTTTGGESQVTTGGESQITTGAESQTTTGGESQTTTGEESQITTGAESQTTTGGESQVTTGGESQTTTGGESQTTTGGESQTTTGGESQTTTGGESQVTTGGESQTGSNDEVPLTYTCGTKCVEIGQSGDSTMKNDPIGFANRGRVIGSLSTRLMYCDCSAREHWLVIQRRLNDSLDFRTKNISEYVDGFGDPRGNYWLGLQAMHELTRDGEFELRIDLEGSNVPNETKYSPFVVQDASSNFKLKLGKQMGALHLLSADKEFKLEDKSGWFGCKNSNLNGEYENNGIKLCGVEGKNCGCNNHYWLTMVEMKIRPIDAVVGFSTVKPYASDTVFEP